MSSYGLTGCGHWLVLPRGKKKKEKERGRENVTVPKLLQVEYYRVIQIVQTRVEHKLSDEDRSDHGT